MSSSQPANASDTPQPRRLFIALLPSDEALDALAATQARVAPLLAKGNPSARANLHLTLAFLGMCDEQQEQAAAGALEQAAASCASFSLSLGGLGCFDRHRGGAIVWRGLEGDVDALRHLQATLAQALRAQGLDDNQTSSPGAYTPHMTLFRSARLKPGGDQTSLSAALEAVAQDAPAATWRAESACLMWSHRPASTGLLTYDPLCEQGLLDAGARA